MGLNRAAVRQPPTAAGGAGAASSCRSAPRPARRGIGAARAERSRVEPPRRLSHRRRGGLSDARPRLQVPSGRREEVPERSGRGSCPAAGRRCGAVRCRGAERCPALLAVRGAGSVSLPAALPPSFAAEGGGGPGRSAAAPRPLAPLAAPGRAGQGRLCGEGAGGGRAGAGGGGGTCAWGAARVLRVPRAGAGSWRQLGCSHRKGRGAGRYLPNSRAVAAGLQRRTRAGIPLPVSRAEPVCHPRARRAPHHREATG